MDARGGALGFCLKAQGSFRSLWRLKSILLGPQGELSFGEMIFFSGTIGL